MVQFLGTPNDPTVALIWLGDDKNVTKLIRANLLGKKKRKKNNFFIMHRELKEVCETLRELNKVVQAENLLMLAVIIQHFNVAMLR